jgi:ABC-type uncharacterized transport system involved in gliding motility auxiliary subunit
VALMAASNLKRYAPFAAVLGAAGMLLAGVIWFVRRDVDVAVQASLAVGLLGLALALLFNPAAVQTWLLGRQARYGGNVLVMVLALLGILVLVYIIAYKNPKRWDLTEDRSNTLSEETLALIKALPAPVKAVGFYSVNMASTQSTAQELLDRYRIESGDRISIEFHDPYADPALTQSYNVTEDGTLFVEMGEQREQVSFASETEISGALSRLMNPVKRVVYFTTGAGERRPDDTGQDGLSQVVDLLGDQNYSVLTVNLAVTSTVPADAKALVVAGPQVPLSAEVVQVIKTYVEGGGKLIVLSDPPLQFQQPITVTDPLADYLRTSWGIDLGNDVVLAPQSSLQGQAYAAVAQDYASHAITQKYIGVASIFFFARSVSVTGAPADPTTTVTPLVMAGGDAWGETTLDKPDQPADLDDADVLPPINFAVVAENSTSGARVVVFGDSDFASNNLNSQTIGGRLLVSSVNWVAKEENLIGITPRVPTTRTMVPLETITLNLIAFVTVLVMPLTVLLIGGVVWFQRRRRA